MKQQINVSFQILKIKFILPGFRPIKNGTYSFILEKVFRIKNLLFMKDIVLRFGLLAFALLVLFHLSKYSLFFKGFHNELVIAVFAGLFLLMGFFSNRLLFKQKIQNTENQEINIRYNAEQLKKFGISKREHEVLQEIAQGLSNQEIAEKLFISESTVKTHVSNLLIKLDAKRRTQAVSNAKQIGIL